jgi:hypothetical protein
MWSILLIRHYRAPKHASAASDVMQQELQRPVPGERERAATLRIPKAVMLLAASTLIFSAGGALAQVEEIVLPALSSGPRDAVPAPTPGIEQPRQLPASQPVFDATSLLPIDSIGAGSDIRPFLDPGVPPDLRLAALRRAWVTDPVIHDFIGLCENFWDFNSPDGMAGMSSPMPDDAGRLRTGTAENPAPSASNQSSSPIPQ